MSREGVEGGLTEVLRELRRRRVLRVLLAYVVVGVATVGTAGIFLPALGFPDWTANLLAVLIVLGLPVALMLAWSFYIAQDPGPPPTEDPGADVQDPGSLDWSRVEEVFTGALELEGEVREIYLRGVGESEPGLLAEVRSLLVAHGRRGLLDELEERVVAPLVHPSNAVTDLEGSTILHYEVMDRLGDGGMGVVYRARDSRLGRLVALKFLSSHLMVSTEAKERFLTEARAAASLDHPNLCTIHETGETEDGLLFISMAYYEGENLRDRLTRGRLPPREALETGGQVARGLAHAARAGIIHRDVKPANLILTEGGVRIVDFGLAKTLDGELTRTGTRMGTVAYMSPEQTQGRRVDERTDVWSLGVVLYEMLTGRRPFKGGSDQAVIHAILHEDPPSVEEMVPDISSGVASLVRRALARDPDRRYPSAEALLLDLERLIADPASQGRSDVSPRLPPEGERRLVTVLASVFGGLEGLMDTFTMEEVDERLDRLRASMGGVVEEFGGVVNEFGEDGMSALFGVPVAHEDDALRAVRASLEIVASAALPEPLEIRAAVGSGLVAIQSMEESGRPYRVGGTLCRDVARLAALAASPGETLMTHELVRTVGPFLEIREREAVQVAPDRPPVQTVVVMGESGLASRFDALPPSGLTRFVGRKDEFTTLLQALRRVDAGQGRTVVVVGEAGVGKSRLLHEFRSTLAESAVRYLQGRCQMQARLTPFLPFIECARAMLGVTRSPPDRAHDQVVARSRALAPELEVYLPVLLHLLSIESEEHPVPDYLAGEDLRTAIAEALVSVFTLGSRGQPLVLFLEDWHWVDSGSEEVLRQLLEMTATHPLLIVVTSRPATEDGPEIPRGQVHLDLAPLDGPSALQVIRSALGDVRVEAGLAERIAEKTGGNPFFVEELCNTLLETEAVQIEGGVASLASTVEDLAIPDTVQAVLKARIDRLDPESREVLRSASVIGRQFGVGLLAEVVPSPSRLPAALDALRAAGLLQRTSLVPEPLYRFKHALTLDVTYESLLARQRRERHALVAAAIEARQGERLDEVSEQLASHFAAAQMWDKAVEYGFSAAHRAAGLWRTDDAMRILERVRRWIGRRSPDPGVRDPDLVRLLLEQERHLETLGRRSEQARMIEELKELVSGEQGPESAIVLVREGELRTLQGTPDSAGAAFAEALRVADACGAESERIMALRGVGHLHWRNGHYAQALPALEEVVVHDRAYASPTVLLRDLVNLGRVLREAGDFERARAIGEEILTLAEETGSPVDIVYALNYRGHLLRAMGRPQEALRAFEDGSRRFESVHLPVRFSFHLLAKAALHLELGQVDASIETYEQSVELARRAGRADNLANALTLYGDALYALGRSHEAVSHFREAATIFRGLGIDAGLAGALGKLAMAAEASGEPTAADCWADVREIAEALGSRAELLEAAEREARLRTHDPEACEALLELALETARAMEDRVAERRVLNSLALLAWRQRRLEVAATRFESASRCPGASEDPAVLGVIANGWGATLAELERYEEARNVLLRARDANRAAGDADREADSESALGGVSRSTGDLARAFDHYEACRELRRSVGDRAGEAWALYRLAGVAGMAGSEDRATDLYDAALEAARESGETQLEALVTGDRSATDTTTSPT